MSILVPPTVEFARIMRRRLSVSAALLLSLLLAGCFATDAPETSVALQQASSKPRPAMTPAVEREHNRIIAAYGGVYKNPKLQHVINEMVTKLVAASERPDLTYDVTILNSSTVNAFALPPGELYVTRGLIALASDSSELASVLAHEMGHVIAQHAAIRQDRIRQAALVGRVASDVLGDSTGGALALAKSKIALATFSQAQELEADGLGIGTASRAGFDPYGAVRFLTAMERNAHQSGHSEFDFDSVDFLSSHPATPERVSNARIVARQFTAPGGGERGRDSYLDAIDGLVYGEDPSGGFVRGRRFTHPRLGFTFVAPPGFTLENTPQAVLGVVKGGGQALRLDVVQVPVEQSLSEYLASGWMQNIDKASIEPLKINGFPAAFASATGDTWTFRLYAIRFGSDVYRFIFAMQRPTSTADQAFRESVRTFRRLSLAEAQAARPLRIKVVTVTPDDTTRRLARRMAVGDDKLALFRTLNGLDSGRVLKPGDRVKLIVE